jgi:hypothetical protein
MFGAASNLMVSALWWSSLGELGRCNEQGACDLFQPPRNKGGDLEDDQLVEIYFQRANEYSLAGSIHKGRVTRVLPGMQSAFVDLGLERDTFLYVSDFFEENGEISTA